MAFKLAEAYVQLSARGFGGVSRGLGLIKSKLGALLNPAALVGSALAGIGTGIGVVSMLKLAAGAESLAVSFEVLLGSGEKAKQMIKDINEFAARTPFEQGELGGVTKQLLAFGVAQEKIIPTLSMLGDIAALSGARISDLAQIYGKAKGTGIVMTEILDQFLERGIPLGRELGKVLGVAESEVRKMAPTGKITFGILQEALQNLTSEGGQFANGMTKLSQTLAGVWSTFTGNFKLQMATIGGAIVQAFDLKEIIRSMSTFAGNFWPRYGAKITAAFERIRDSIRELAPTFRDLAGPIAVMAKLLWAGTVGIASAVVSALQSVSTAVGGVTLAVIALGLAAKTNPVLATIAGVVAAVGLLKMLADRFEGVRLAVKILGDGAAVAFNFIIIGIRATGEIVSSVASRVVSAFDSIMGTDLGGWFTDTFGDLGKWLSNVKTETQFMLDNWDLTWKLMQNIVGLAIDNMEQRLAAFILFRDAVVRDTTQEIESILKQLAFIRAPKIGHDPNFVPPEQGTPGGAPGGTPGSQRATEAAGAVGKFRFTSLAGLADQMQTEAGKRLAERNASANERTATAVERIADRPAVAAMTPVVPIPAWGE